LLSSRPSLMTLYEKAKTLGLSFPVLNNLGTGLLIAAEGQ
jgi:hypothetical protein